MVQANECHGCTASVQHESYLNNTYDVPWTAFVHDDSICVDFDNTITQTNVRVRTWVEDADGNGDLTAPFELAIPPGSHGYVCFSDFGTRADQVTPRDKVIFHVVLTNADSASTGVSIWHRIH